MATRTKKTTKRTTAKRTAKRGRSATRGSNDHLSTFLKFAGGIALCGLLIAGIGVIAVSAYRSAVESDFFNLRSVEVTGNQRVSTDDVKKIVTAGAERSGVWAADLAGMKERLEKLPFVKTAAVSASLPSGIRVDIVERAPVAVARLSSGQYLIDSEGNILAPVKNAESNLPVVLKGWNEEKSEAALKENAQRLKSYIKITNDWKQDGMIGDVSELDLHSLREPVATISEGGHFISVDLSADKPTASLRAAKEAVAGKGDRVKAVDTTGVAPVLQYIGY